MRRELISVFVALSTMIVLAFLAPLAWSTRSTAFDRALDEARAASARLVPLIATGDHDTVAIEINRIDPDRLNVTVYMPDGDLVGTDQPIEDQTELAAVVEAGVSISRDVDDGHELITVVNLRGNQRAAVRVLVPREELQRGVWPSWLILGALGVTLVLIAVGVADQLAQRVTRPARRLGEAADALGQGNFDVVVEPEGPAELAATATAFNLLAGRVQTMLDEERAMVSTLAHRLRTPVTRLRIDLDQVDDPDLAARLNASVDALTLEVNDLVAMARHRAAPPTEIDVVPVVRDRYEFWSALAADEGRESAFHGGEPVTVAVDPDELGAAIDALIENVFSHTERPTAFEVTVTNCGPDPHERPCIIVDDAGTGFDPALTEAGRSGAGSTGLGLAIVERLAAKTGGGLEVGVSPQGGARVTCLLGPEPGRQPKLQP